MSVPPDDEPIFDSAFLGRLRSLFFKLQNRTRLKQKGAQQTPVTGFTREFKDHRAYTPGDDYREIDWRLYARLDKLFIRLFEAQQEFHVHVVIDISASMADPHPGKRIASLRLAAAVTYLTLINQHRVSLYAMSNEVSRQLPPFKGQGHIYPVLRHLEAMPFGGVTQLAHAMKRFRPSTDRKGITFVISDLFGGSLDEATEAVSAAGHWPTETHLVQVMDPNELQPNIDGEVLLIDTETDESRRIRLTKRDRDRYIQTVEAFTESIANACARRRINHVQWTIDEPFEHVFMEVLSRGSALARR